MLPRNRNSYSKMFKTLTLSVVLATPLLGAEIVLGPIADGTIADGGILGPFDGTPDGADWYFNESSYEGAITLARSPAPGIEHRVIFEFDLSAVEFDLPVSARLSFSMRGAPRFPAPSAKVVVVSYEADLLEDPSDFTISPDAIVSVHEILPFQVKTTFVVDVGDLLNDTLSRGVPAIGFRFQIDPGTPDESSQAFMDILETEPETKPKLTISDVLPGDIDGDRDIDTNDYVLFPFCLDGVGTPVSLQCRIFDLDGDLDVDLTDFGIFTRLQALYASH